MRRPVIAANWKMHMNTQQARDFFMQLTAKMPFPTSHEIVICPQFPLLPLCAQWSNCTGISVGAQDLFWEEQGAFTGEVSALLIRDCGCSHVIVGHSERRQYFNETDATINKKLSRALACGLTPIFCVGETLKEREKGVTFEILKRQLAEGLAGIEPQQPERFIIAYEPVWAIGTGKNATPDEAQEAHQRIRAVLAELWSVDSADNIRILYGGSIKPENFADILVQRDIDGGLVGGASLKVDSYYALIATGK